jgi:hypothetical protein
VAASIDDDARHEAEAWVRTRLLTCCNLQLGQDRTRLGSASALTSLISAIFGQPQVYDPKRVYRDGQDYLIPGCHCVLLDNPLVEALSVLEGAEKIRHQRNQMGICPALRRRIL